MFKKKEDSSSHQNKCLVIGASGFIGQNLCIQLLKANYRVTAFSRSFPYETSLLSECNWILGDFQRIKDFEFIFEDVDYIIHLVATLRPMQSNQEIERDISENLIGTLRLLDICKKKDNIKRLIFISSGGTVYGPNVSTPTQEDEPCNPNCSYGITKLAIEKYLNLYRRMQWQDSVVLRVANPYGPFQSVKGHGFISTAIQKLFRDDTIEIWGDGSNIRDYIYVSDVVNAIIAAINLNDFNAPRTFNIGSGTGKSLNQILSLLSKIHKKKQLKIIHKSKRFVDVPVSVLDISRAKHYLQWVPDIPIHEGLRLTYEWKKNEIEKNS